jgi:hypothetical protein
MQDLLVVLVMIAVFVFAVFAMFTGFCIMLKGMFKIADKIFGA